MAFKVLFKKSTFYFSSSRSPSLQSTIFMDSTNYFNSSYLITGNLVVFKVWILPINKLVSKDLIPSTAENLVINSFSKSTNSQYSNQWQKSFLLAKTNSLSCTLCFFTNFSYSGCLKLWDKYSSSFSTIFFFGFFFF